jgi:hypothetical protein
MVCRYIALEKYLRFGIAALTFADKKLSSGNSTNILLSTLFENRALKRIFGPKRGEVTEEWRKLLSEELNDLYSSHSIVRVIKSRRMRWSGHVARMGRRGLYRILVGKRGKETTWKTQAKMEG